MTGNDKTTGFNAHQRFVRELHFLAESFRTVAGACESAKQRIDSLQQTFETNRLRCFEAAEIDRIELTEHTGLVKIDTTVEHSRRSYRAEASKRSPEDAKKAKAARIKALYKTAHDIIARHQERIKF